MLSPQNKHGGGQEMTVRNVESPVEAAQERKRSGARGGNRHEIAAGEDVRHSCEEEVKEEEEGMPSTRKDIRPAGRARNLPGNRSSRSPSWR